MQLDELVFDITSKHHNLKLNRSGGYHAYPNYEKKEFNSRNRSQNLRKRGIVMAIWGVKLELTESDIAKYFKKKIEIDNNTGGSYVEILSTRIITDIHFMNFDTNEWEKMDIRCVSNLFYDKGCEDFSVSIWFHNKIDNQRFINKKDLSLKIKVTCLPAISKVDFENMEK